MNFGADSSFGFSGSSSGGGTPSLVDANNGLSKSSISPTTVVLGEDAGDVTGSANLLSNRLIPLNGFILGIFGATEGEVDFHDFGLNVFNYNSNKSIQLSIADGDGASFMLIRDPTSSNAALLLETATSLVQLQNFQNIFILSDGQENLTHDQFEFDPATQLFKIANGNEGFNGALFQVAGPVTGGVFIVPEPSSVGINDDLDIGKFFTNDGSIAQVTLDLPAASANLRYHFLDTGNGIVLKALAGDVINFGATASAAGGTATSTTKGCYVMLVSTGPNAWYGCGIVGVWLVV